MAVDLAASLATTLAGHPHDVQVAALWMLLDNLDVERRRAAPPPSTPPPATSSSSEYADLERHGAAIVAFCQSRGGRVTTAELLAEHGCSHETLRHRIRAALDTGQLVRATKGVFKLVALEAPAAPSTPAHSPKRRPDYRRAAAAKPHGRALGEVELFVAGRPEGASVGDVVGRFGLDLRVAIGRLQQLVATGRLRYVTATARYVAPKGEVAGG